MFGESSGFTPALPIREFEGYMPNPLNEDKGKGVQIEEKTSDPEWVRDETLMSPPHPSGNLDGDNVIQVAWKRVKKLLGQNQIPPVQKPV